VKNIGLILILLYCLYVVIISIRNILIGKGKITHPLYDEEKKREHIYKKGLISLLLASPAGLFLLFIVLIVIF
jgi:hypothetical protein